MAGDDPIDLRSAARTWLGAWGESWVFHAGLLVFTRGDHPAPHQNPVSRVHPPGTFRTAQNGRLLAEPAAGAIQYLWRASRPDVRYGRRKTHTRPTARRDRDGDLPARLQRARSNPR